MSTPPSPISTPGATPIPANIPPGAPPPKGGSLLVRLLATLGAGVVILALVAIVTVGFLLRGSRIRRQGKDVEITTPLGDLKVQHGADPGLPRYPGAVPEKESARVELTAPTDDKLEIIAARLTTDDAIEKVDAWYRDALGTDFEREGPGEKKTLRNHPQVQIDRSETAYVSDRKDTVRLVVLNPKSSGVEIKLVRFGPREAQ